jgi:penicillin-binding protein 1C
MWLFKSVFASLRLKRNKKFEINKGILVDRHFKKWGVGITILVVTAVFFICVPYPLFRDIDSTVLESRDGELLGARIAPDGQWRFPEPDSIPAKFKTCLLAFEDRHFYRHPGINPFSIIRATVQNIRNGKIVSGGSTLTMQVARLARPGRPRNILSKLIEMVWALNLECRFTKEKILKMYVSHAPYGGNVVGLEAASWRYYQRPPDLLSWSESATLAILPNAPSLIFPGRNDSLLKAKRDRLLEILYRRNAIDSLTLRLSKLERLPGKVFPVPSYCRHLLDYAVKENPGKRIRTTLELNIQDQVNRMVERHAYMLSANHVYNACALVAEVKTGNVLAYTGNVPFKEDNEHGFQVDVIRSRRSSGSILKPFLYAAMLNQGMLTPDQLIADIPTRFKGFSPENFSHAYDGAVPASQALSRSLNVPAVRMLQQFGVESFYYFLKKTGMTTLSQPPGHYGLSLILGGAETKLWDLAGMYASLARIVRNYEEEDGFYPVHQFQSLIWKSGEKWPEESEAARPFLKASAVYLTLKALLDVHRPEEETGWEAFAGTHRIAWKTGTSFGFRDGWAVGITRDFVVAIWAGNCDGEGRPGLTGSVVAAPLLFEIFGILPQGKWFSVPGDEMETVTVCKQSGYLPSPYCTSLDTLQMPIGIQTGMCPYHRIIHLDREKKYRVSSECYPVSEIQPQSWFVLPPAMEFYYKRKHPDYVILPPVKSGCLVPEIVMEFIYPREMDRIFIPRQLDNSPGEVIFELAHRNPQSDVYWYLDDQYVGKTTYFHQLNLRPSQGWHLLSVVDQEGNQLQKRLMVVENRNSD